LSLHRQTHPPPVKVITSPRAFFSYRRFPLLITETVHHAPSRPKVPVSPPPGLMALASTRAKSLTQFLLSSNCAATTPSQFFMNGKRYDYCPSMIPLSPPFYLYPFLWGGGCLFMGSFLKLKWFLPLPHGGAICLRGQKRPIWLSQPGGC